MTKWIIAIVAAGLMLTITGGLIYGAAFVKTIDDYRQEVQQIKAEYAEKVAELRQIQAEFKLRLKILHTRAETLRAECGVEYGQENCDFSAGKHAPKKTATVRYQTLPQALGATHTASRAKIASLNTYYRLKNDGGYKNKRIADLQDYATQKGVAHWKQRYMIAWFLAENGALSENRTGDHGYSVGLCQCHRGYRKCAKKGDYEGQKQQCIDWFATYTADSTEATILRDLRRGHNPRSRTYERAIKSRLSLLQ